MRIVVIDGQSGRLGAQIIEGLRKAGIARTHTLVALGANSLATSAMLRAGADQGATGENPVVVQSRTADVIAGPIGIVLADALLGEITPKMAMAVGQSAAKKVLVPVNQCCSVVAGVGQQTRLQLVEEAVQHVLQLCGNETT